MIPLHPVATGRPDTVRWVVPDGAAPVRGSVTAAPGDLGTMLTYGVLAAVDVADGAVTTRAGDGSGWSELGPRVRTALHAALAEPAGWATAGPPADGNADTDAPPATEAEVRSAVGEVLDGALGDFLRAHGGRIDLVGVRDGVAEVRLTGACHGCPAAAVTLHDRLEAELRRRLPGVRGVRGVRAVGPLAAARGAGSGQSWRRAAR